MDFGAYAADLKSRMTNSVGKRLRDSGMDVDFALAPGVGITVRYIGQTGQVMSSIHIPITAADDAEFATRAEAAVAVVFPEVPRPTPKAITVAVEEPLPLAESPAKPPRK